jgi:glycosyltransferase involved in cell wall biosynthesis
LRVLFANKFWFCSGGVERVIFDEVEWLEGLGHETVHFAAAHPDNQASPWSRYFPRYLDVSRGTRLTYPQKALAALRLFHNREAARRFEQLLADSAPDVIHAHSIHRQVSPSILAVAKRRGIPVVQTLHEYHHVCPADNLLRGGRIPCEPILCTAFGYGPALRNRCLRGSLPVTALSSAERLFQRATRSYERGVGLFISPSRFLAQKIREGGWRTPVKVIPNAVRVSTPGRGAKSDYFLFAGRLVEEKGIAVLSEAARLAGVRVVVAGDGPLRESLQRDGTLELRGWLGEREIATLTTEALASVVPSVWFENAPMSILEPMAAGTAVVASAIGGISEQIDDGVEGLLTEPGDAGSVASAMTRLASDAGLARRMGEAGRVRVRRDFSPEGHVGTLLDTYRELCGRSVEETEASGSCG